MRRVTTNPFANNSPEQKRDVSEVSAVQAYPLIHSYIMYNIHSGPTFTTRALQVYSVYSSVLIEERDDEYLGFLWKKLLL